MHPDDLDLTDDLRDVATLLRRQRTELSGSELERIKYRATGPDSRPATTAPTRKNSLMRSRSVITALLASGIFLSGGSVAVGVSGLVANDSASVAQYGPATPAGGGVLGASASKPGDSASKPGDSASKPAGGVPGESAAKNTSPSAVQPIRQIAATSTGTGQLPFTGLAVIPILLIGLVLLSAGIFLLRFGKRSPVTR